MNGGSIPRGFGDPVSEAQATFRSALDALANPGRVETLAATMGDAGVDAGVAILLAALADFDTPVWLPPLHRDGPLGRLVRFHCSAPLPDDPARAAFGVLDGKTPFPSPPLSAFDIGDARYPDRSATLLCTATAFTGGEAVRLTGPGVETERVIAPAGLRLGFWEEWTANAARFPLGVDVFLVCGRDIIGLPRTLAAAAVEPA